MKIYQYQQETPKEYLHLSKALGLPAFAPLAVYLVGGGGKTSLMYRLAKEFSEEGKQVIVTTTTHIAWPDHMPVCQISHAGEMKNHQWEGILAIGQKEEKTGKLIGLPLEETGKLLQYADVVLLEADGAKCLPLKVPKAHEPVILPESQAVIACCGLDAIGKPLSKVCFRWEQAVRLLNKEPDSLVTPRDMAVILSHKDGSRKQVENREYRMVLNKADTPEKRSLAEKVIRELKVLGEQEEACLVTSFLI